MRKVVIGIQARSTSTRFPGKVSAPLGGNNRRVLDHVINACKASCRYLDRFTVQNDAKAETWVITPYGDPVAQQFSAACPIMEGPEDDVLTRYVMLMERTGADYIVRITSDCPLIEDAIVSKHIQCGVGFKPKSWRPGEPVGLDYLSNIEERCRTAVDGHDVEVISNRMLQWANANATTAFDREHVTTAIRQYRPAGYKIGCSIGRLDLSDVKLSIDEEKDLISVARQMESVRSKVIEAQNRFGKDYVFRF